MMSLLRFLSLFLSICILTTRSAEQLRSRETKETDSATSRIVDGTPSVQGRYPYMASLKQTRNRKVHVCGATLIAPSLLLTAAHCYQGADDKLVVIMNPHSIFNEADTAVQYTISESRIHPDYAVPQAFNNDFMLIKINGESTENPVKLNTDPDFPPVGQGVQAIGWGKTGYQTDVDPQGGILSVAPMGDIVSNAACDLEFSATVTPDWICAINDNACQGDSGGPLLVPGNNAGEDIEVGITSWGIGCGSLKFPGIYARISDGWEWIRTNSCEMALGDVPSYFDCPGPTTSPSRSPTDIPSVSPSHTPSVSSNPTEDGVRVTISILTDGWPVETSWQLVDEFGVVIAARGAGYFTEGGEVYDELLVLNSGMDYALKVGDAEGDGICCRYGDGSIAVILGDNTTSGDVLAYELGTFEAETTLMFTVPSFSMAPTSTPSQSRQPSMAPTIKGDCPEIPPGGCPICGEGLCVTLPNNFIEVPGQPSASCATVELVGLLQIPGISLSPEECEAIPRFSEICGCATGTSEPSARPSVSVAPTVAPSLSVAPSLAPSKLSQGGEVFTVAIRTDSWPQETSWAIQSESGDAVGGNRFGDMTEEDAVTTYEIKLQWKELYIFGFFDQHGDGNCCRFGNGEANIYYGTDLTADALLLTVSGEFSQAEFVTFIAQDPAIDGPGRVVEDGGPAIFCFPGDTTAQVQGRGEVFLRDVKLGDEVLVGDGSYEPVYSFGHKSEGLMGDYVQLVTDSTKLELSSDHMVFVENGRSIPASLVQIGDYLVLADGALSLVQDIARVVRKGAYAPFTPSGTIVVNGVKASSFVAFQGLETLTIAGVDTGLTYQFLAHAFEGPHRTYCRYFSPCESEEYTEEGISMWVYLPHKAGLWFINLQSPLAMTLMSVPVFCIYFLLACPVSCLMALLVFVATSNRRLRIIQKSI